MEKYKNKNNEKIQIDSSDSADSDRIAEITVAPSHVFI